MRNPSQIENKVYRIIMDKIALQGSKNVIPFPSRSGWYKVRDGIYGSTAQLSRKLFYGLIANGCAEMWSCVDLRQSSGSVRHSRRRGEVRDSEETLVQGSFA